MTQDLEQAESTEAPAYSGNDWATREYDYEEPVVHETPRVPAKKKYFVGAIAVLLCYMAAWTVFSEEPVVDAVIAFLILTGAVFAVERSAPRFFRVAGGIIVGLTSAIGLLTIFIGNPVIGVAASLSPLAGLVVRWLVRKGFPRKSVRTASYHRNHVEGPRILGTAGLIEGAAGVFGEGAVKAGAEGERATAKMLEPLLRIPGTVIYHGLRFPGSANADVDHAVVQGNRLVLIDSKRFRAGAYWWRDSTGTVIESDNGAVYENHMRSAAAGYKEILRNFSGVTILPIIAIHGKGVTVPAPEAGFHITMTTAEIAVNSIGALLAAGYDQSADNPYLRAAIEGCLKN